MIIYSPLEQFCITSLIRFELINTSLSFTNSSLFLLVSCGSMYFLYYMSMYRATILPNNWQLALEFLYGIVANTLAQSVSNKKEAGKYFPFMFFLFSFILFSNLAGMVPYSFCVTSHLCVTFTLGLIIWVGTTFIGFKRHGFHFFSLFMPSGAPFGIMPFLIGIELLSFIFKGISISVRLFANMMAGHSLMKILAGFGWAMYSGSCVGSCVGIIFPGVTLIVLTAITALEVGIAFLQAYVFIMLSCMYLNDCLSLH